MCLQISSMVNVQKIILYFFVYAKTVCINAPHSIFTDTGAEWGSLASISVFDVFHILVIYSTV